LPQSEGASESAKIVNGFLDSITNKNHGFDRTLLVLPESVF
jgi:hypothetical protein